MNSSFEIKCEWPSNGHGNLHYQLDQVDLSILVNGKCATVVEDYLDTDLTIRRVIRVSPLHLAEWLAGNWWRLRWEPEVFSRTLDWQMSHDLASAGGGYVWPSLLFSSDGENISVSSRSSAPQTIDPILYLRDFKEVIAVQSFEQGVDEFIRNVLAQLSSKAGEQPDLAELWLEITRERLQPELSELRKLEALLGYDPAEAPENFIEQLQTESSKLGVNAVQEVAAASKDQALIHLLALAEEVQNSAAEAYVPSFEAILQECEKQTSRSSLPWQRAEKTAHIARGIWALDQGPVSTKTLAELFRIKVDDACPDNIPLSAGLCMNGSAGQFRITLHQRHPTGRRFTLARLVADCFIKSQGDSLLPATSAGTSRQKFQRAFASEFLCPFRDLWDFFGEAVPDEENIDRAADYFEVSSWMIISSLANKGAIKHDALDGWF